MIPYKNHIDFFAVDIKYQVLVEIIRLLKVVQNSKLRPLLLGLPVGL